MTCIVAVSDGKKVTMGGDSAGVAGLSIHTRLDPKVFRNGPLVIGFTSSFRMGQLLRFNLQLPELHTGDDLYSWMVVKFIPAIRKTLGEGGYTHVDGNVESGGKFLVGIDATIFTIDSDFQVGMVADGYDAVGCGQDLALGSLYTTKGQDPYNRVVDALDAACHHSAGVRPPYNILETE